MAAEHPVETPPLRAPAAPGAATDPTSSASRLGAALLAALLAASLLPYLNAFGHEFVRDDEVVIRDNTHIRSVEGLLEGLTSNWWGESIRDGLWRPLVMVSFAANHAVSGLRTWSYTAFDLAVHAAVVLLLVKLALACGIGRAAAVWAGLLFAVHPVHTEAVTGFVGRADTMATLCVLLALLAHRRAARSRAARMGTWAAVAAALLCKEQAVALLPLLPLMDALLPAPDAAGRPVGLRRRVVRDHLPLLAVLLLYLAARVAVLGALGRDPETIHPAFNPLVAARVTALGDVRGATPWQALWTPFAVLAEAARLLLWPAELSFDYSWRRIPLASGPLDPRVPVGLVVVAVTLVLFVRCRRRAPAAAFGLALLAVPYLVVANVVFVAGTIFGERLLYLPSAGLALAAADGIGRLRARRPAWRPALAVLLGALVVLGGARTWRRNPDWRDADRVTAAMVRDTPESFLSHYARGVYLLLSEGGPDSPPGADPSRRVQDRARRGQAIERLQAALEICPEYEQANRALVVAAWAQGDGALALPAYERLTRITPQDARVHQGLAEALLARASDADRSQAAGLRARALAALDEALRLDPAELDALVSRAQLLIGLPGREADAVRDLRAVLRLDPARDDVEAIRAEIERLEAAAGAQ